MLTIITIKQVDGQSMNFSTQSKYFLRKLLAKASSLLCLFSLLMITGTANAAMETGNAIKDVHYSTLPGNRIQIRLELSKQAVNPLSFTIDNPARIAFDFANTGSELPKRSQPIGLGVAQSMTTISTKSKTRVILNLTEVVPYQVTTQDNNVLITLDSEATGTAFEDSAVAATTNTILTNNQRFSDAPRGVSNIDFRRGEEGEGRVIIQLSDSNIPMDINEEFGKVMVKFIGVALPDNLRQTLDVLDFATPVKSISSYEEDGNVRIEIEPINSNFEHVAYQANNIFSIELKTISKEELEEVKKEKFGYTGERLSLNFQDIPVRAVLQLIADFTSLNVVVSDSVDGNLTLRLKNVPWDQALDIILKAKGLSKRESGTVMLIAPSEEIAAQEKIDLEAQQSITELAPIRSAFFTINFAKVTELASLFSGEGSEAGGEEGSTSTGILSPRGSAIVDKRTNTLIIKDTEEVISEIRRTLKKLDVPIRQVMISSRIVIATDQFSRELGSRFGVTRAKATGDGFGATTGTFAGADTIASSGIANIGNTGQPNPFTIPSGATAADRLNVDLGTVGAAGSLAFAVLTGSTLIDLEISALQAENEGEVISSPRVVTADRHMAHIEQGVEIPYLSASSSGATQVEFKKAVLSIEVTPQITPDDRVIMDLSVNNDTVGDIFSGIPSIDTREVETQVLVNNGDTVVLGGIYEQIKRNEVDKVPFLGDIPLIGYFFRHTLVSDERRELLIFVTPKILKESLSL